MNSSPRYPTRSHENAARFVVEELKDDARVKAILLTCSCARGKASSDSCLDMAVLVDPSKHEDIHAMERDLERNLSRGTAIKELESKGKWCALHLSLFDGNFTPGYHGWETGPDEFELEIGNFLVYSYPLFERDASLQELKKKWLPYYDVALQGQRLVEKIKFFTNNLDHVPGYASRGLYFACFNRLYHAHQEFLQALFIKCKIYPVSYVKWVKEQITEILALPDLYPRFTSILELPALNEKNLLSKCRDLYELGHEYLDIPRVDSP